MATTGTEFINGGSVSTEPLFTRPVAVACVLAVAAMVVGLVLEGRVLFCGCGSWSPWISDVDSQHCSQHLLDAYSASHVLHGVVFFGVLWRLRGKLSAGWRLWACVALEAGWEVLENSPMVIDRYRTATIALGYTGDSVLNSLFDVLSCVIGYWIASRLNWKWSVAFFAAVELVMLASIRDSLSLNVLMLVYPLDVVKNWQMR
jgi:hypothetical protein